MSATDDHEPSSRRAARPKARGDDASGNRDVWQRFGMNGDVIRLSGDARRALLYAYAAAAIAVGAVSALNVLTAHHQEPQLRLLAPILWEGTSWLFLIAFFWIPWIGYRLAPIAVRPRL
ncbi:MAG: hypothetical protein JO234_09280, partial [Hyphomicrobiales bacterium]|nr:hypothetical protein [Hyphomicrobiales bacterium]